MRGLLGDEAGAFESSLAGEPVIGLRVNTLKVSAAEFEAFSPWPLERVPWCPAGYLVPSGERPGLHPFHAAGLYYLQDPSAMAVAGALAPQPGELVLDLAAAPGGKSTHIAALLGDDGVLVANDVSAPRARELTRNLERWGARRAVVTSAAPTQLASAWGAAFDAVLLDAPCSGEGMFRKTPQALEQWSPELVASCAARQDELLAQAARLVKPGGRLVYSTCTFAPEENERTVATFLAGSDGWEIVSTGLTAVSPGRPDWAPDSAPPPARLGLAHAARLWPHRSPGEGHFVALLRRAGDDAAPTAEREFWARDSRSRRSRSERRVISTEQAIEGWRSFVAENLEHDPFGNHDLIAREDGLYARPTGAPALDGLRVLRPGLWLGGVERGRFEPSHSLALALPLNHASRSVDLDADDPRLLAYLEGAELEVAGDDGWLLVAVAGHPLGWGRRARDIVKNRYPKGLRLRAG